MTTATQTFEAQIIVWDSSSMTSRTLVNTTVQVGNPGEARQKAIELINITPGGDYAYYNVPGWPNQNIRSVWTHGR